MGKTRVIAETGAGQHGVATATACALFGLDCTIYMGEIDTQRQALNVARMRMLGAEVIAVKSGSRTLKDAINEAFRDWVANVDRTHYLFGTVAGPHPFPAMVRDFHRVIGVEARRQILERAGRLPDAAVGVRRRRLQRHRPVPRLHPGRGVRLVGCEPAGHGVETGEHAATLTAGEPGHPARLALATSSRTRRARSPSRTRSRPVSTTRASAPSTRTSRTPGAAEYRAVTDDAAMQALRLLSRTEGIIPAIESAHALAGALELGRELGKDGLIVVNLSGRGDKDMDTAARYFGLYDTDAGSRRTRPEAAEIEGDASERNIQLLSDTLARRKAEGRAALIAYLPAGFPTVDGGIEAIKAVFDGGADVVEVGLPHSDPVLDGPVIQTADDIALRGGVRIADVIRTVREAHAATGKPVLVHDVLEPHRPLRRRALHRRAGRGGRRRAASCPTCPSRSPRCGGSTPSKHGLATVFVVAPSSKDERLAKITAAGCGFVYAASLMGVTGTRESVGAAGAGPGRRTRATTELPVCVGLGVSNAAQAAEVAGFADGVIVGSAFVKRLLDAPRARRPGSTAYARWRASWRRACSGQAVVRSFEANYDGWSGLGGAVPLRFVGEGVSQKNREGKRAARERLQEEREKEKARDKRRRTLIVVGGGGRRAGPGRRWSA